MNFGCSLSNATVDPTAKSTTRPATASAAGSQKRKARRTRASGSMRSPASSHTASTVTPCLRPALMSSRYIAELMSAMPGYGAGEGDERRRRSTQDGWAAAAAVRRPVDEGGSDEPQRAARRATT